jgi:SAM-dependent methyltransferase
MPKKRPTTSRLNDETLYDALCDPISHNSLKRTSSLGLANDKGTVYKFVDSNSRVIDFIEPMIASDSDSANLEMYNSQSSTEIYRNFLNWLFETFGEDEKGFRGKTLGHLKLSRGMKVLVTGCGLGDDLPLILNSIGVEGEIHAQDLSKSMVVSASKLSGGENICFSISNATSLPYVSRYFDAVYHFGGINLFGDTRKAIAEMERVCKIGGRVLFGDEGIAPHLRGTQYADIAINNNPLWAVGAPMNLLPHNATNVELAYVLGNCFYLIAFTPSIGFPQMNIDVEHKGTRGGSARTRYFGKLEGVTERTKEKLIKNAKERRISIHSLLEEIINSNISDQ